MLVHRLHIERHLPCVQSLNHVAIGTASPLTACNLTGRVALITKPGGTALRVNCYRLLRTNES